MFKVIVLQIQYGGKKTEILQETLSPIIFPPENATIGPMLITGFHSKRTSLNISSYPIILEKKNTNDVEIKVQDLGAIYVSVSP